MINWDNVQIEEATVQFNSYNRPLWNYCHWCNAIATHLVTRTSKFSGDTYTDYVCEHHLEGWRENVPLETKGEKTL